MFIYVAKEFAYMRRMTTKADVFSFGVVVMEFFTRRRPTGTIQVNGMPLTLRQLVEIAVEGGTDGVVNVVDQDMDLPTQVEEGKAVGVLELALSCTRFNAEERPDMSEVLSALLKLSKLQ